MKLFSQEEGFSLIEVLVAIALLALISVSFLTLFTSAYAGVFLARRESETLFQAQQEIERIIQNPVGIVSTPKTVSIDFHGSQIEIIGKEVAVEKIEEERGTSLTLFIPDP